MCQTAAVSRAGFYRSPSAAESADRDIDLRDAIQKITLEMPVYGRRRLTAELQRRGWKVNHKRVSRIMREHNWLCLCHCQFVVPITHPAPMRLLLEKRQRNAKRREQRAKLFWISTSIDP